MLGNLFRFCFCVWFMETFFLLSGQLKSDSLFLPTPEPPTLLSFWRNRGFSISFFKELISNESSRDQKKSIPFKQLPMCTKILGFFFLFRKEREGGREKKKREGGQDLKKIREMKENWVKETWKMSL